MAKVKFDAEDHSYRIDGKIVPSVTKIIQPLYDFSRVPRDIMERAQAFGTAVHDACDLYDADDLVIDTLDPAIKPYLDAWIKFKTEFNIKDAKSEIIVHSEKYQYAGRVDNIFRCSNRWVLVDKKTCTSEYKQTRVQLAGYKIAAVEMGLLPKKCDVYSVRLLGDGRYKVGQDIKFKDEICFMSLLNVWNWNNEG